MEAIGKAMLGVTIQCAQYHTRKYDPLAQTDYYRMFVCVNNCDEGQITTYTDVEQREWRRTARLIRRLEDRLRADNPDRPAHGGRLTTRKAVRPWPLLAAPRD